VNYLLWNLFGPSSWPLWLSLVTVAAFVTGRVRLARAAALASVGAWLVLAVLPTGWLLMERLETRYPRPASLPADVRHVVVLAGAERLYASAATGALELNAHGERVAEALPLARALPSAKIWIVGGVSKGLRRRDVDWTADYWRRAGLEPARIGRIGGTLDTCGNAAGIAARLPGERVMLVTSAFHMPRAMACMRAAGVAAIPYPVDRQAWLAETLTGTFSADFSGNLMLVDLALHEYVGLVYYRLRGWL
jgi:uncharacterized SAM-binding protein YcdF (DUF218 family)